MVMENFIPNLYGITIEAVMREDTKIFIIDKIKIF